MKKILMGILFLSAVHIITSCNNNKTSDIEISAKDGIKKGNIRISMEVLGSSPVTEIFDGRQCKPIPDGYGENEWYFVYEKDFKGYIRHIKTNRNDSYKYNFLFYTDNDQYFVEATIIGIDTLKKTIALRSQGSPL